MLISASSARRGTRNPIGTYYSARSGTGRIGIWVEVIHGRERLRISVYKSPIMKLVIRGIWLHYNERTCATIKRESYPASYVLPKYRIRSILACQGVEGSNSVRIRAPVIDLRDAAIYNGVCGTRSGIRLSRLSRKCAHKTRETAAWIHCRSDSCRRMRSTGATPSTDDPKRIMSMLALPTYFYQGYIRLYYASVTSMHPIRGDCKS